MQEYLNYLSYIDDFGKIELPASKNFVHQIVNIRKFLFVPLIEKATHSKPNQHYEMYPENIVRIETEKKFQCSSFADVKNKFGVCSKNLTLKQNVKNLIFIFSNYHKYHLFNPQSFNVLGFLALFDDGFSALSNYFIRNKKYFASNIVCETS